MINSDNFECFRHGLIVSKIWLCENLEQIIDTHGYNKPVVNILGGWQNILGFMMQVRRPGMYNVINSYDKDESAKEISDLICDAWKFEESKVNNITMDVTNVALDGDIFINCSVDQFNSAEWYDSIPLNKLVCIQTTNIVDDNPRWEINQKIPDIDSFKQRYPMQDILFEGTKEIRYHHFGYDRLMLIGIK